VPGLGPGATNPVYVTGHSKGGAMASIGAYILNQTYGIPIKQVVTFASPKPGDTGFQTGYQSVINNQVRYENYGDIVPLVPPATEFIDLIVAVLKLVPGDIGQELVKLFESAETWDYAAVGSLLFIESAADHYKVVSDEPIESQVWIVVKEFGEDCFNDFDFTSFGNAHSSTCGYGYMSGTCPTGVCPPTAGSAKSRSRKSRPRSNR
jgi:hypothetical protein